MNAYLMIEEKELIPTLKGFYEDKKEYTGKKQIENGMVTEIAAGAKEHLWVIIVILMTVVFLYRCTDRGGPEY